MVKKMLCLVLAAVLAAGLAMCVFAANAYVSESVPVPQIGQSEETDTGADRVISLAYSARTAEVEKVRQLYLEQLLTKYTTEEIAASDAEWILHETVVFCEVSLDGKQWFTVKTLPGGEGETEVSLFGEIMPALEEGGVELYQKLYGFNYRLRLVTASDDYDAASKKQIFACSAPSEELAFACPEFTYIDCVIPEDAQMEQTFSTFMYYPNETEIALPYPTREGYFFAGWLKWNGGYTETVPAHTRYFRATAQWDPRTYAVNYVLATDIKFNFGRANNLANPTTHTVGQSETLYNLKSPVGGYSFDGWYLDREFTGERLTYIPAETVGDIILYAKWATFEELEARQKEEHEAYARSLHYGDIDMDGNVSSADARLALRISVGLENLSAEALRRADIFDSGIVTPENARTILRIAVGLDSLYDVLKAHGLIGGGTLDKD